MAVRPHARRPQKIPMTPLVLRDVSADEPPARAVRKEARTILAGGGLVALPTETVYGIAARADLPAALERLRALKDRDAEHVFTWHVSDLRALDHFPELPALVGRLAARYWPGPLTLVLKGVPPGLEAVARSGWTGVRLPAHTATRAVLEFAGFPVVMTSANRSGEPPTIGAGAVREAFGDGLDLILDDGATHLSESSSVLAVGQGRFELLREGLFSLAELRATAGLSLTFVCTGNTCRSPMAEGLARSLLALHLAGAPEDFGFTIRSTGVFAGGGSPPSEHAVTALRGMDIDIAEHRSRPAISAEIGAADRVYCMTASHVDSLTLSLPPGKARHVILLDPDGRDLPDPIGGSLADYRACAESIRASIQRRLPEWA